MSTTRGFWKDIVTGKIYAIESDTFGNILGGAGPLEPDKLRDLDDYEYKQVILEWLQEAVANKKLRRITKSI